METTVNDELTSGPELKSHVPNEHSMEKSMNDGEDQSMDSSKENSRDQLHDHAHDHVNDNALVQSNDHAHDLSNDVPNDHAHDQSNDLSNDHAHDRSNVSVNNSDEVKKTEENHAAPPAGENEESDISEFDSDENVSNGDESDIEDNYDELVTFPSQRMRRTSHHDLPETVTVLRTETGGKLYLIGTAHFSQQSQDDVRKVIEDIQPDIVVVELCPSRVNILHLDENTLLEEAKNLNFGKLRDAVKQGGVVQGVMHILLLNMSAHLTKQLGMAPGGEFRAAFREARKIPGCRVQLGDRPIQVTLKRAFASLSWWQRLRLAWYMITSKDPISAEEVEKCKQKDLLEEMIREMAGEFPHISKVFVDERDLFLAHTLRQAVHPIPPLTPDGEWIPATVVGVVGIGHVGGIVNNWDKVTSADVAEVMKIPPGSALGSLVRWSIRAALVGLISWGCYGLLNKAYDMVAS